MHRKGLFEFIVSLYLVWIQRLFFRFKCYYHRIKENAMVAIALDFSKRNQRNTLEC